MKQKKFIEVYDNLLHSQLVNEIEELLLKNTPNNLPYTYISNITTGKNSSNKFFPGFNFSFIDSESPDRDLTPFSFFLSQILYKLSNHLNFQVRNIIKARSFLQVPPPNPQPNMIHTDLSHPHWVCLYYVTDSDGDTIMFDDDENEIKRVSPKKGRIVFFDGSIKHCSSSPSKTTRSIINFDFIGEFLDKQE